MNKVLLIDADSVIPNIALMKISAFHKANGDSVKIEWVKSKRCIPYIMRDISCWGSANSGFYVDVAAYCNQVGIFKKFNFAEFLSKRYISSDRKLSSMALWYNSE